MSNSQQLSQLWTGECQWRKNNDGQKSVNFNIVSTSQLPPNWKNWFKPNNNNKSAAEIRIRSKPANVQKYEDFRAKYFEKSREIEEDSQLRVELRSRNDDLAVSDFVQHLKANDNVGLLSIKGIVTSFK
jgi:hypothetical protein